MLEAGNGAIWRLCTSQKRQKCTHEKQAIISQGRNPKRITQRSQLLLPSPRVLYGEPAILHLPTPRVEGEALHPMTLLL